MARGSVNGISFGKIQVYGDESLDKMYNVFERVMSKYGYPEEFKELELDGEDGVFDEHEDLFPEESQKKEQEEEQKDEDNAEEPWIAAARRVREKNTENKD